MTDHKFEPGQLVLVRDNTNRWRLKHFSHINTYGGSKYATTDSNTWQMCIPFNDDTKHLQNTTQHYEPPKPPVEYEWAQKVEVLVEGIWCEGVCLAQATSGEYLCSIKKMPFSIPSFKHNEIRQITCRLTCSR